MTEPPKPRRARRYASPSAAHNHPPNPLDGTAKTIPFREVPRSLAHFHGLIDDRTGPTLARAWPMLLTYLGSWPCPPRNTPRPHARSARR